ncbi:biotin/lipoate--protein ligase family protein [Faunimonas sp. B44]|uniref:biotin/lipoate--protein ligase family protein n=1 Tax=Faunimonas sp. B44 TaxID=3461493 RepID=UPI004044923B
MAIAVSSKGRTIDLPPLYRLVTLRESGDALAHARSIAAEAGAATLVWVGRFDIVEFALVLEPEEPLATARRALYAGMNALADALAAQSPPERPIQFEWPDAIRVDGVLVGGVRLAWPDGTPEDSVPDWLVFAGMLRTAVMRAGEPGLRPLLGALDELGFEGIDGAALLGSFARHMMLQFDLWNESGFDAVARRWLQRLPAGAGALATIEENGDLFVPRGIGPQAGERRSLRAELGTPSWRDPETGLPWL